MSVQSKIAFEKVGPITQRPLRLANDEAGLPTIHADPVIENMTEEDCADFKINFLRMPAIIACQPFYMWENRYNWIVLHALSLYLVQKQRRGAEQVVGANGVTIRFREWDAGVAAELAVASKEKVLSFLVDFLGVPKALASHKWFDIANGPKWVNVLLFDLFLRDGINGSTPKAQREARLKAAIRPYDLNRLPDEPGKYAYQGSEVTPNPGHHLNPIDPDSPSRSKKRKQGHTAQQPAVGRRKKARQGRLGKWFKARGLNAPRRSPPSEEEEDAIDAPASVPPGVIGAIDPKQPVASGSSAPQETQAASRVLRRRINIFPRPPNPVLRYVPK